MVIEPNKDGTYTLRCCNGYAFTGTYQGCQHKVTEILDRARR